MMKKIARMSAVRVGLAWCLALLTGCDRHISSSSIEEAPTMQTSNKLTTRCIGRYLIDLPADLALNPSGGQTIDDVRLWVTPATADEYKKALVQRTAALNAAVVSSMGGQYPALRKTMPLPAGTDGVLFERAELQGSAGRIARVMEVLAWRDGYLLKAEVTGVDTSFPEEKDNITLHTHVKTDVSEKSRLIIDVVSRTSGRTDLEIPSQQGVCIVNGFVRGAPTAGESIGSIYQFAKTENLFMRIASISQIRGKNTILERIEITRPLIEKSKGKIFRKAKRDVGGMNGYEAAYSMLTDESGERGSIMIDRFRFELNSAEGSARKPIFTVELSNGESLFDDSDEEDEKIEKAEVALKPAPLSTAAVENIWDKIIPTIRARPNAF
ncbi:MAG: T6SS immunity protein Tli4 family protein [Telluria sp.]